MSFSVYKSSAGSGKTFTLVKAYLRIVLSNPDNFRQVLAITFTNKAANEMKERIMDALTKIVAFDTGTSSPGIKLILDQLHDEDQLDYDLMVKNARRVLQYVLHDYSEFAISTIDSFVHRIIRSFAFDLHVPMNFDVEVNAEELLQKAVDLLINEVGSNELLTRFLVRFIQSKMYDDKSWNIEFDLLKQSKTLLVEDEQAYAEKLQKLSLSDFLKIEKRAGENIREFENHLGGIGSKARQVIQSKGLVNTDFYRGNQGVPKYFEYLQQKRRDKFRPNAYVGHSVNDDKWYAGKTGSAERAAIDSIKGDLINFHQEAIQYLDDHEQNYMLNLEARKNLYPIAILSHIDRLLQAYKNENDILLVAEFNRLIAKVVLNEPVPFIYERVGEKYHHYLLDEFQDTSLRQWQNLLPLIENALASGYDNLIVGDAKQAIYRWRGGEVEQFLSLPKIYKIPDDVISWQRQEALERNYQPEILKFNFRSKKNIIDFNNAFFEFSGSHLGDKFSKMYAQVAQQNVAGNEGGFVQVEFYDPANAETDEETYNLERTANIIKELLSHGFEYEQIAVLVRNNMQGAKIASYLLEEGIPVISAESLLLGHSEKVRLLMALLRFVYRPDDKLSRLEILTLLMNMRRIEGSLHELASDFGILKGKADDGGSLTEFYAGLASLGISINRNSLRESTPLDMIEQLIRSFQLMPTPDPYVQFFLDAVLAESAKRDFELPDLLEWWELKNTKLSILTPEGVNAVEVMTIHKSKGLEFPVVIYPFASEAMRISKTKLWVDLPEKTVEGLDIALLNTSQVLLKTPFGKLYEDEVEKSKLDLINLTYVAFTRASEALFVISSEPKKSSKTLSLPFLLKEFLNKQSLAESDKQTITIGELQNPKIKTRPYPEIYPLQKIISSDWKQKLQLSLQAPAHWVVGEPEGARNWGNTIHRILANIRSKNDIKSSVEQFVNEGILPSDKKNEVMDYLTAFINQEKVSAYFSENVQVINEADILLPDGTSHRPDRIVMRDDELMVVDYKTGIKKEEHIRQVKRYMDIMREMGYRNVKGAVLYLNETTHEFIS